MWTIQEIANDPAKIQWLVNEVTRLEQQVRSAEDITCPKVQTLSNVSTEAFEHLKKKVQDSTRSLPYFDATRWLHDWLKNPHPLFEGETGWTWLDKGRLEEVESRMMQSLHRYV